VLYPTELRAQRTKAKAKRQKQCVHFSLRTFALEFVVGAIGFEPTTSRSQTERTTRLCYAPIKAGPILDEGGAMVNGQSNHPISIFDLSFVICHFALALRSRFSDHTSSPLAMTNDMQLPAIVNDKSKMENRKRPSTVLTPYLPPVPRVC
jgi:hypothetical protein